MYFYENKYIHDDFPFPLQSVLVILFLCILIALGPAVLLSCFQVRTRLILG